jgi:nucleoside-diphosphate-sugar epimerase
MLPARPVTRFPNTYAQGGSARRCRRDRADLTKALALLGYEPQVDLAEGLRRQWEWPATSEHRSHPTTIEAVATPFG